MVYLQPSLLIINKCIYGYEDRVWLLGNFREDLDARIVVRIFTHNKNEGHGGN